MVTGNRRTLNFPFLILNGHAMSSEIKDTQSSVPHSRMAGSNAARARLNNTTQHSNALEVLSLLAEETPSLLWNQKVH
jgi:hypothetical protein